MWPAGRTTSRLFSSSGSQAMRVMFRRWTRSDDVVAWVVTALFYATMGLWVLFAIL